MMEIWWPIGPPPAKRRRRWLKNRASSAAVSASMYADEPDAGGGEPGRAIAGQVELPARLAAARREEATVGGFAAPRRHRAGRRRPRTILPDTRSDRRRRSRPGRRRGATMAAIGRLDHAANRAAPAGMGGAGHTGLRVGQQDRRAVGGDDAERDVGPVGHHGVGARAVAGRPRRRDLHHRRRRAPASVRRGGPVAAPIARAARARFSSTASRASPPDRLQLRLA